MTNSERGARIAADQAHLIHPQHHPSEHLSPHIWERGKGIRISDAEGRTYIDGLSGMWNVNVGHGRRELIDAATRQLESLPFATSYAGASNLPVIALAEKLKELVYPGIDAFYFTCGGGEATDTSIRTARYFWRAQGRPEKSKIIARELSYHGSTIGSSSATGVAEFSEVFGPRLPGFLHIASPYPYRFVGEAGVSPGIAAANKLEEAILREGPETVAAFIAEPIQGGGGGVLVPQHDYFQRIREICDRYQVLFISDDVITGFGRTGRWFGLEHWGVEPDIVQFAKGITSGYFPLGGIGISGRIKAVLDGAAPDKRWWHGYTYSGHPVGAAVALANIAVLEKENLVERSAQLGLRLLDKLASLASHSHVGEIRGLGLLAAVEVVEDRASKASFPGSAGVGQKIRKALLDRGLLTRLLGEVICLAPPLVSTEADIDQIAEIVQDAIVSVLKP
jgi:adenosylmethionine-8-amino-7-oxononanoate aminotransferase